MSSPDDRTLMRGILHNLENSIDVVDSLTRFKEMMVVNKDNGLIVLVLQKIHNVLHGSYDVEYIRILIDIIDDEEVFDEIIRIFMNFKDKKDFVDIIINIRSTNEMILFKYLRELKENPLFNDFVEEMDSRYLQILDMI